MKKRPVTLENGAEPDAPTGVQDSPTPYKRRPALASIRSVRLELARVYRASLNNEMPLADACRRTFMLQQLAKILETETLESRILALEQLPDAAPARLPMPEDSP